MTIKRILLLFFALIFHVMVYGQKYQDVIYLKNGNTIRGNIIMQDIDGYVKIQNSDGIFICLWTEISKIVKEQISPLLTPGQERAHQRRYDTSTLKVVNYQVVNEYGTVFNEEELSDLLGYEAAAIVCHELNLSKKIFQIPFYISFLPEIGGGLLLGLTLAGVIDKNPYLGISIACVGAAAAMQVAAGVISGSHNKKASSIINNYKRSLYSLNISPSIYSIPGETASLTFATGLTLCLTF